MGECQLGTPFLPCTDVLSATPHDDPDSAEACFYKVFISNKTSKRKHKVQSQVQSMSFINREQYIV